MSRGRFVWPGAGEWVFLIVLATSLWAGQTRFLNDPGTFWHVRLGRDIAASGCAPRSDALTYTRLGAGWVDQSWLFDWGLAKVVGQWGWPGAVAATALVIALIYAALARGLIAHGTSPLVAVVVTILAAGIGTIHFLTRPHLTTFAGVLFSLWACRDFHLRGSRWVWLIPLVMVAWANLHGGFLAGPVVVGGALAGEAVSGSWDRERMGKLRALAIVLALSALAPLINPYGFGLYRHVAHLLVSSGVTDLICEYQPMPFGKFEARVVEWVVLGLIALPVFSMHKVSRYDLVQALIWLHLALATIRHAPLFAFAVAPALATLIDGLMPTLRIERHEQSPRRLPAWAIAAAAGLALAVAGGANVGRLDPAYWPLAGLDALSRQPATARIFHEQDWGGMIEDQCVPTRLAFIDDRFELWGRKAILEYCDALQGGPVWDSLDGRERFDCVWLRPARHLAKRLRAEPGWRIEHEDGVSILFQRAAANRPAARD